MGRLGILLPFEALAADNLDKHGGQRGNNEPHNLHTSKLAVLTFVFPFLGVFVSSVGVCVCVSEGDSFPVPSSLTLTPPFPVEWCAC